MKLAPNRLLALLVLILVIAAGSLALIAGERNESKYAVGSPESVVQNYLKAMADRDTTLAKTYLSSDSRCDIVDLDRSSISRDTAIDLIRSEISGSSARVDIRIRYATGDLFNSGWSEEQTIRLINTSGKWLITGVPWPLYSCEEVKP